MGSNGERSVRIAEYLEFSAGRRELFRNPHGGVRIILDPQQIADVEDSVACDLRNRGLPPEWANVGIVLKDPWIYVLRDAVEFPDGSRRTHARVVNRGGNGAAALPLLEGKIVLVRHFRHAVRDWLLEIPRGGIEPGSTAEDTARRETEEELGARVSRLAPLGFVHGSSNLQSSGAHLFLAEIESVGRPELHEGITAIERLSLREFEAKLLDGAIRDAFTAAAYALAKLRGLL